MSDSLPDPDGCLWCDHPQRGHFQRYKEPIGWHKWTEPADAQRLARMKARRAAWLAARQPKPYITAAGLTLIAIRGEDRATPLFESTLHSLGDTDA